MIVLHHLNNSRSQRVLWLLEELGLPYRIERYQRDAQTMLAPPALRAVHPLGKSPVIVDERHVLAESGAIIEYLVNRRGEGRLRPAVGSDDELRYQHWLHFAEGSAMPPLLMSLVFARIESAPMPFFVKPVARAIAAKVRAQFIEPQLKGQLDFIESELVQRPWFAGEAFTAADVQMSFPLEAAEARGVLGARPAIRGWLERIHDRPAWKRALETGGPYELLR